MTNNYNNNKNINKQRQYTTIKTNKNTEDEDSENNVYFPSTFNDAYKIMTSYHFYVAIINR